MDKEKNLIKSKDGISWLTDFRGCPLCQSDGFKELGYRGGRAHREGNGVESKVVRCKDCNAIYTYPTLIPQTNPYDKHTSDEYFHLHDTDGKVKKGEIFADYAKSILGKTGKMLELGCGRGEFLVGAINRGWHATGVEMTETFAQDARSKGLNVEINSVEESIFLQNGSYDVILLEAILEHLYDPVDALKKIYKALRPGGLLFVDVPNEASLTMQFGNLYMKMRGRDWVINLSPTFPPYHVVGFSPSSLRRALEKTGFKVHKMETPIWENTLPEGSKLEHKFEHFMMGLVQSFGKHLGRGDGIECWAVKEKQ